jgi:hypothetical protein
VKYSTDDGATWLPLEYMGIDQNLPDGWKNTYDALVDAGYGKPATRRLPYADYGITITQDVTAGGAPQEVSFGSYGANGLGLDVGEFAHVALWGEDEEYVRIAAVDVGAQTFTAVFTKDHSTGATVRPTIWPTPVINEGDSLAFDILAVASPDAGSDLTIVVQT